MAAGGGTDRVDVLCCGLATLDVIQYVGQLPSPGRKITAEHSRTEPGGPATNAARVARWLGSATTLATVLGHGPVSGIVRAALQSEGVDVLDATPPGGIWQAPVSAVNVTASGERTVVSANATGAPRAAWVQIPAATVCLVDGHHLDLALAVASAAHSRGTLVLLDGGSWKPGLERLLPLVDVAVLSSDFVCPVGHRPALERVRFRAVSNGPAPIQVMAEGQRDQVEVPQVPVVDTLGAGDSLHGALAHFLAAGGEPTAGGFTECLRSAARIASDSCTHRGVLPVR